MVRGFPPKDLSMVEKCLACAKGKQHEKPCKLKHENYISSPLEVLYAYLFGPISIKSIANKSYCLVGTDYFLRYFWVNFYVIRVIYRMPSRSWLCQLKVLASRSWKQSEATMELNSRIRFLILFLQTKGLSVNSMLQECHTKMI